MTETQHRIAESLDRQFAEMGFATQGVEALRAGADVSLRTLYKYFPSREAMVVGALAYRDQAYGDWIAGGPGQGAEHVLYPLKRLGEWLEQVSSTGCLFLNALAAYPDSDAIRQTVEGHKTRLQAQFRTRLLDAAPGCDAEGLSAALFLLHEGLTEAARFHGPQAAAATAFSSGKTILLAAGID